MDKKQRDIELAREVGFNTEHPATNEYLHRFAQRVREEERAACAKEADTWANNCVWEARTAAANIANSIRQRGQA